MFNFDINHEFKLFGDILSLGIIIWLQNESSLINVWCIASGFSKANGSWRKVCVGLYCNENVWVVVYHNKRKKKEKKHPQKYWTVTIEQ